MGLENFVIGSKIRWEILDGPFGFAQGEPESIPSESEDPQNDEWHWLVVRRKVSYEYRC